VQQKCAYTEDHCTAAAKDLIVKEIRVRPIDMDALLEIHDGLGCFRVGPRNETGTLENAAGINPGRPKALADLPFILYRLSCRSIPSVPPVPCTIYPNVTGRGPTQSPARSTVGPVPRIITARPRRRREKSGSTPHDAVSVDLSLQQRPALPFFEALGAAGNVRPSAGPGWIRPISS
jgi:hypothetical protein